MGIKITGTIGIILQAFDEKLLTKEEVEKCLLLLKEANIRVSESLCNMVYEHIEKINE